MIPQSLGKNVIPRLLIFISGLVVFSGCATLGKDECLNADWRTIGYEDGAQGYLASRISSHRKDCAKHGITPDFYRYEEGRLEGLREYCTPQKGYNLGKSGRQYNSVCPGDLESVFLKGYYHGKSVHDAQMVIKSQQVDLNKMHEELRTIEKDLHDYEEELVHDDIGPRRRKKLLEEFKILTEKRRNIIDAIAHQEALLETSKLNLQQLISQHSY
jgi:hypothetical protein